MTGGREWRDIPKLRSVNEKFAVPLNEADVPLLALSGHFKCSPECPLEFPRLRWK
jgi:hypothetical protein